MNINNIRTWTQALRSGDFNQSSGVLASRDKDTGEFSFCCLGVAEIVRGLEPLEIKGHSYPGDDFAAWIDIKNQNPVIDMPRIYRDRYGDSNYITCSGMNDGLNFTFSQIADMIDYFGLRQE